jgi:hypothetical protein
MKNIKLFLVLSLMLFVGYTSCSKGPDSPGSKFGSIMINAKIDVSSLSHDGGTGLLKPVNVEGELIGSATISVSGDGMDTITEDFDVPGTSLTAEIKDVPVGTGRTVTVLLNSHNGFHLMEGSTTVDVVEGETSETPSFTISLKDEHEIRYDTGSVEFWQAGAPGHAALTKITPDQYPAFISSESFYFAQEGTFNLGGQTIYSNPRAPIIIEILDNNFNLVGESHKEISASTGNTDGDFYTVSYLFNDVIINSGDFYISMTWVTDATYEPTPILVYQQRQTGRSFYWDGTSTLPLLDGTGTEYTWLMRAYLIY